MDPIRFSISNPVTVSVGVLLIVLFGLISLASIPVQLTPSMETTVIAVTTRWEGASPQEIEREVVREQEDKLKGITSLIKMVSTCEMGEGEITLEFTQGTTKEQALREVSDRLREVRQYPENVDEPVVRARNPADRDYITWVVVRSTDPDFDVRTLYDFFEERVKPELERVPGVAEVNILGGWEREVHVRVDPYKLAQRGITPSRFADALRTQNRSASAGQIAEGKYDIRVRSIGRYENLDQIEQTLLSRPGEPVVRVGDVAIVSLAWKDPARTVRNKGQTVLAFNAQREVGSNVIQVMEGFKAAMDRIDKYMLPAEAKRLNINGRIYLEQVYDQTIYIHQAVDLVIQNLWIGGILAITVLLIFLRSLRSTLIVALAIPTSIIGTFLAMAAVGRTINVVSLAGMAFAVGMVVDNAIVVLENIDRHRRMGQAPVQAAYRAAREVWGAILASTLTTLAVFIPVLVMQEEAGQLFRDISLAICAAVTLSLFVAVTVIPSAGAKWLPLRKAATAPRGLAAFFASLNDRFTAALAWLNRSWTLRLGVIAILTSASILAAALLAPPSSYLPGGNRNLVFAQMYGPPSYNLDQQEAIGRRIEEIIRPYWQAASDPDAASRLPEVTVFDPVTQSLKTVQPPPLFNFFFVALPDRMFMGGISADPDNVAPIADLFNSAIRSQPVLNGFASQSPLFRTSLRPGGSGDAIEQEITGPDLDELNAAAFAIRQRLMQRLGGPQFVRPTPSNFDLPGPEVRVTTRLVEAADVGLTQQDINVAVQIFGDGAIIGDFLHEGQLLDLKILAEDRGRSGDPTDLRDIPVAAPIGRTVPLHAVATVERGTAPQEITRVDEQRAVSLSINVPEEMALDEVIAIIESEIADLRAQGVIPPAVNTPPPAGSAAKLREVKQTLLGTWTGFNLESIVSLVKSRMFLALLIVFLLMASLFESWFYPFVIMFAVPFAAVGGFLGLRIVHEFVPTQQLDVLTMLGFVILIGIVVNNAILIVHQTLNLIRGQADVEGDLPEKLPPQQAIVIATRTRVRPIFMTMFTSVLGMTPLVVFPGSGSELYRGLGSVVVGGLLLSTLFTLILVPTLLSVVFELRDRFFTVLQSPSATEPA